MFVYYLWVVEMYSVLCNVKLSEKDNIVSCVGSICGQYADLGEAIEAARYSVNKKGAYGATVIKDGNDIFRVGFEEGERFYFNRDSLKYIRSFLSPVFRSLISLISVKHRDSIGFIEICGDEEDRKVYYYDKVDNIVYRDRLWSKTFTGELRLMVELLFTAVEEVPNKTVNSIMFDIGSLELPYILYDESGLQAHFGMISKKKA